MAVRIVLTILMCSFAIHSTLQTPTNTNVETNEIVPSKIRETENVVKENPSEEAEAQAGNVTEVNGEVAVRETTLYQDMMMLGRIYAPSVVNLIEFLQKENLWELTKEQFWALLSFFMGWTKNSAEHHVNAEARSGQTSSYFSDPLMTIPFIDYPVTRHRLEGFVMDSIAVYRKWQNAN